jgi:hypothetical protein
MQKQEWKGNKTVRKKSERNKDLEKIGNYEKKWYEIKEVKTQKNGKT